MNFTSSKRSQPISIARLLAHKVKPIRILKQSQPEICLHTPAAEKEVFKTAILPNRRREPFTTLRALQTAPTRAPAREQRRGWRRVAGFRKSSLLHPRLKLCFHGCWLSGADCDSCPLLNCPQGQPTAGLMDILFDLTGSCHLQFCSTPYGSF